MQYTYNNLKFFFFKEKKKIIKKFKREINAFKHGINMYEQYLQLQLSIDIKSEDKSSVFNITMKNLKNDIRYNIIFEEIDNNYKRKCTNFYFVFK